MLFIGKMQLLVRSGPQGDEVLEMSVASVTLERGVMATIDVLGTDPRSPFRGKTVREIEDAILSYTMVRAKEVPSKGPEADIPRPRMRLVRDGESP